MASPIGIHVSFNRLPQMAAGLPLRVQQGVSRERDTLTARIRGNVHVITGFMRDHIIAQATTASNGVITTVIQSQADYSAFEELGTRFRPGHFRITDAVVTYGPTYAANVAAVIEEALR